MSFAHYRDVCFVFALVLLLFLISLTQTNTHTPTHTHSLAFPHSHTAFLFLSLFRVFFLFYLETRYSTRRCSILAKVSLPVEHAGVAIIKLCAFLGSLVFEIRLYRVHQVSDSNDRKKENNGVPSTRPFVLNMTRTMGSINPSSRHVKCVSSPSCPTHTFIFPFVLHAHALGLITRSRAHHLMNDRNLRLLALHGHLGHVLTHVAE
jgi:hypothetical protein